MRKERKKIKPGTNRQQLGKKVKMILEQKCATNRLFDGEHLGVEK